MKWWGGGEKKKTRMQITKQYLYVWNRMEYGYVCVHLCCELSCLLLYTWSDGRLTFQKKMKESMVGKGNNNKKKKKEKTMRKPCFVLLTFLGKVMPKYAPAVNVRS